ncbi:MAG: phosphoribosylglycinamide formyltransferase [Bacteroidota bacterium]
MKKIAIFASGSGSNAENIVRYFENHKNIKVNLILSNKKNAYVLERAKKFNIPSYVFTKDELYNTNKIKNLLLNKNIDLIVLAGFLLLVPEHLIKAFPNRIINIHPALLPKYGGKGMYGDRVHQKVLENGDKESGITIHYVNEKYDEGQIIHQSKFTVEADDHIEDIAQKAHELEYKHYPGVIEQLLSE